MKSLSTAAACMENACNFMFSTVEDFFIINIASLTLLLLTWYLVCADGVASPTFYTFSLYDVSGTVRERVRDEEENFHTFSYIFSKMLLNFLDVAELTFLEKKEEVGTQTRLTDVTFNLIKKFVKPLINC